MPPKTMTTIARPQTAESSHWYTQTGEPAYEVPRADGRGMRKTTLADARKLGLVPSVTQILRILDKPALTSWLIEQACLSVLTTPRIDGEGLDAFVERVLHTERVQDQESQKARDRGSAIHAQIVELFQGRGCDDELSLWVLPAFNAVSKLGNLACCEKALANDQFGGMVDLVQDCNFEYWLITDWKTTKKLPTKGAYPDHVLQCASYAKLWKDLISVESVPIQPIRTQNVYISTVDPGAFIVCPHEKPWQDTYERGFAPLLQHWRWSVGL